MKKLKCVLSLRCVDANTHKYVYSATVLDNSGNQVTHDLNKKTGSVSIDIAMSHAFNDVEKCRKLDIDLDIDILEEDLRC